MISSFCFERRNGEKGEEGALTLSLTLTYTSESARREKETHAPARSSKLLMVVVPAVHRNTRQLSWLVITPDFTGSAFDEWRRG